MFSCVATYITHMKEIRGAVIIVGGAIGAGFISGAELVRFFHTQYFFFPVLISSLLFSVQCAFFLWLGKKYGGYEGALRSIFGRASSAIKAIILVLALIPCAGMLAGLDALLPNLKPLASILGIFVTAAVIARGIRGISLVNLILVPLLLIFVFAYGGGQIADFYPVLPKNFAGFGGGVVYAGMNVFLIAPVLLETGKDVKRPHCAAFFAAIVITATAFTILGTIYRAGEGALESEMPFLYVMQGKRAFSVMVALAIMTSLASSLYPLMEACGQFQGYKKYAAKTLILLAAFALSRFGLTGIVSIFYPVEGILGLFLSAFCVLHEKFLKQHDKKVHHRRKQTENDGRAHYKIQLKDLPTVHDEISKSSP